jgi:hypothetical protein
MRRQHDVSVFATLALLNANDHAFAVDVADLERGHLGGAQTRAIGHAQTRRRILVSSYKAGVSGQVIQTELGFVPTTVEITIRYLQANKERRDPLLKAPCFCTNRVDCSSVLR